MWPGQRDPRCHDAAYAHETPQPSFLHAFKDLLLRDYSHTSGNRAPGLHPPLLGTSSSEHSSARVSSDRADRDEREPTVRLAIRRSAGLSYAKLSPSLVLPNYHFIRCYCCRICHHSLHRWPPHSYQLSLQHHSGISFIFIP